MCLRWFNLPQFLKGNVNKYINEQSYKGGREVLWVHRDLLEEGDVRDGGIKEGSETKGRVEEKKFLLYTAYPLGLPTPTNKG